MKLASSALLVLVAALHVYFLVLEMFLWQGPKGRALSRMDGEMALATAPLAANQGLYNGFLAAGLIWGLIAPGSAGLHFKIFFLVCVMAAGLYGAATVNRRILLVQFAPAAVALALVLLTR
ncbi:membrane protein [Streptomyces spinoverrucosus]|uniref:Membrane protein n=1 Tax=Streptomyces spinoverrucosus TaxID=284043 RepID=A0A4Y3VVE0_9ACTN|nr:DUF1304 domain-containing protein [Streptomyces spinoverrucosus]GEC10228.1 membrane protein [Streptomyces spinoverrucosus]GHB96344.1 membrane protein [Streptomyces spinoverrucosus]